MELTQNKAVLGECPDTAGLNMTGCQHPRIGRVVHGTYAATLSRHHHKMVYRKTEQVDGLDVLIYFWDTPSQPEERGWWIAPTLGDTEVWAFAASSSNRPPRGGWKVPYDGEVDVSMIAVTALGVLPVAGLTKPAGVVDIGSSEEEYEEGEESEEEEGEAVSARRSPEQAATVDPYGGALAAAEDPPLATPLASAAAAPTLEAASSNVQAETDEKAAIQREIAEAEAQIKAAQLEAQRRQIAEIEAKIAAQQARPTLAAAKKPPPPLQPSAIAVQKAKAQPPLGAMARAPPRPSKAVRSSDVTASIAASSAIATPSAPSRPSARPSVHKAAPAAPPLPTAAASSKSAGVLKDEHSLKVAPTRAALLVKRPAVSSQVSHADSRLAAPPSKASQPDVASGPAVKRQAVTRTVSKSAVVENRLLGQAPKAAVAKFFPKVGAKAEPTHPAPTPPWQRNLSMPPPPRPPSCQMPVEAEIVPDEEEDNMHPSQTMTKPRPPVGPPPADKIGNSPGSKADWQKKTVITPRIMAGRADVVRASGVAEEQEEQQNPARQPATTWKQHKKNQNNWKKPGGGGVIPAWQGGSSGPPSKGAIPAWQGGSSGSGSSGESKRNAIPEWKEAEDESGKRRRSDDRSLAAVDVEGRPYDLQTVVVNFANVGANYAKKVLKRTAHGIEQGLFDWEGVRRCVMYLTQKLGLKVVGVIYENFWATDNDSPMKTEIPDDLRAICESVEETPRIIGRNHSSADDEMTIKCAYHRNCRFMDNDNYRDWKQQLRDEGCRAWLERCQDLLHMRYYFDSFIGVFETLDGNVPPGLLAPNGAQMPAAVSKRALWHAPNR